MENAKAQAVAQAQGQRAKPRIKAAKPKIVDLETDVPVVRAD